MLRELFNAMNYKWFDVAHHLEQFDPELTAEGLVERL